MSGFGKTSWLDEAIEDIKGRSSSFWLALLSTTSIPYITKKIAPKFAVDYINPLIINIHLYTVFTYIK